MPEAAMTFDRALLVAELERDEGRWHPTYELGQSEILAASGSICIPARYVGMKPDPTKEARRHRQERRRLLDGTLRHKEDCRRLIEDTERAVGETAKRIGESKRIVDKSRDSVRRRALAPGKQGRSEP